MPESTALSIREERASAAVILAPSEMLRATGRVCFGRARAKEATAVKARARLPWLSGGGDDWGGRDGEAGEV